MNLSDYLRRIGFSQPAMPTFHCLAGIHRAHALSVPYENLDVLLGRHLDFDLERIFEKIVTRSRGGWCYSTPHLTRSSRHGLHSLSALRHVCRSLPGSEPAVSEIADDRGVDDVSA